MNNTLTVDQCWQILNHQCKQYRNRTGVGMIRNDVFPLLQKYHYQLGLLPVN